MDNAESIDDHLGPLAIPPPAADTHPELSVDPDRAASPPRLHRQTSAWAWVFTGGLCGTALRYVLEMALPMSRIGWPAATLLINVTGAFVLGALLEGLARLGRDVGWRQRMRLFAGTGICGAFTTYSTFALETNQLLAAHRPGLAIGYALVSLVGGTAAAWLGIVAAATVHRRAIA